MVEWGLLGKKRRYLIREGEAKIQSNSHKNLLNFSQMPSHPGFPINLVQIRMHTIQLAEFKSLLRRKCVVQERALLWKGVVRRPEDHTLMTHEHNLGHGPSE